MNPNFQMQYSYPSQQYSQQSSSSYGAQGPNFSAMYSSIQPYNSKQFLLNTFGNRVDYIQVFLSLSHEDKLMMYMLTEQKKIYGQIKNKESYQRLLKEIAQKVQNYHKFHDGGKKENKQEEKSKELEHKIDDIVEKTFEKLHLSELGNSKYKKQGQEVLGTEEDQEQWVQSQQQPQLQPTFEEFPKKTSQRMSEKRESSEAMPAPIMSMFSFDSQMEKAMTQQIGLKSEVQKKSIWDLQLGEDEVRPEEPNLKEIFKSQVSVQVLQTEKSSNPVGRSQEEAEQQTLFSNSNIYPQNPLSISQPNYQNSPINDCDNLTKSSGVVNIDLPLSYEVKYNQQQNANFGCKEEDDEDFVEGDIVIQEKQPNQGEGSLQLNAVEQKKQEVKLIQNMDLFEDYSKTSQPVPETVVTPSHPNQFQFDFLEGYSSQQKEEELPQVNEHHSSNEEKMHFQEDASDLEAVFSARKPEQHYQYDDEPIRVFSPRNELFSSNSTQNYKLLSPLKVQLDTNEKEFIEKMLKNKSFQCETQFYEIMMKYLRQISLKNTEQYRHFKEQHDIVKDIHQETEKYTKAVDEDEEDKVFLSIKRTKTLYQRIYGGSNRTEEYTKLFLKSDHHEKGFLFKFGKVLVDSCINQQILQKVISQEQPQKIENSFYLLYVLQKCNSLSSLKNNADKIMVYVNQEYEKYRHLDAQKMSEIEDLPNKPIQYLQYIQGLVVMLEICEKMISLLKAVCMKSQSNMVRTLKICKDIKSKYKQYRSQGHEGMIPQVYKDLLKREVQKNSSLYDLHLSFANLYVNQPFCKICLHSIGERGGQQDGSYFHYSCYNLLQQIQKSSQAPY